MFREQSSVSTAILTAAALALALLFFQFGAGPSNELGSTVAEAQSSITLVRGPYLQQVEATHAIVVWATRQSGAARVEYRSGSGALRTVAASSTFRAASTTGVADYYQHEAALTGLTAGTTYTYDLRNNGIDPTPGITDSFKTAPAQGTGTVRLVAFGDSGNGSSAQQQIASAIGSQTFDFAVHTGDVAYSRGTYADFDAKFFPYYRTWLRSRAIFPSIGNHDDMTASATPYRTLFVLPRDGATATFPNNAERFYSVDYGPVHLICLDTEAAFLSSSRQQEQLAWLAADLQASQGQPWRIVFFHRPPYSSGAEHGSNLPVRQAFGPLFEQYNVQFVLNGHEHSYERTVPWRESTNNARQAVTYIVTGGAGGESYPVGRSAFTAFARAVPHFVRMTISPSSATLEAVGANGAVIDRYTLSPSQQKSDTANPQVSIVSPGTGSTLTGSANVSVSATDDVRVEKVDLWIDGQLRAIDLTSPYSFTIDTTTLTDGTHSIEARAYDIDGKRASSARGVRVSNGAQAGDIVLYAAEAPVRAGSWRVVTDSTAAGGKRLEQPDAGAATIEPPLANPQHYVELGATVEAGKPYRVWLRLKGASNSGYSDSVWVQASDSVDANGNPIFRIGTTSATRVNLQDCAGCSISGWGWQDNGYGTNVLGPTLRFATGGAQTIRIQAREDGVSIDQIVLSPATYLTRAPGALKNDTTILAK